LEVLARHYLKEIYKYDFEVQVFEQYSSHGARFTPFADRRLTTIEGLLGKDHTEEVLEPIKTKWRRLFEQASETCEREGVADLWELAADHPGFQAILEGTGFISIPQSALNPMDTFPGFDGAKEPEIREEEEE
jgi:hypothetical protein